MSMRSKVSGIRYRVSGIKFFIFSMVLAGCSLQLAACGYTTRSTVSNKYKTIYISPFANRVDITSDANAGNRYKIYKPLLETDITKSVTSKFLIDGNLRPVKKESADLILKGELVDYRRDALSYNNDNDAEQYRINLVVDLSLWDNKENRLIWEEKSFTGETDYFASGVSAKSETSAVNDAIADLSRRIVNRAVDVW